MAEETAKEQGAAKPHFNISANVVKQLGEELVSDEVTALLELVKNCYDADADYANIVISTHEELNDKKYDLHYKDSNGYILINDNGDGMDENDIVKGWLRISISKKKAMKENGETTPCGRTPLGDKGLGRLSTQRLANKVELFTAKKDNAPHHVYFNWNDFNEETVLTDVQVKIKQLNQPFQKGKGTSLILADIKDADIWTGLTGDKIKAKLSQLLSPIKSSKPFRVFYTVNNKPYDLQAINEGIKQLAIAQYAFIYKNKKLVLLGKIKLDKLRGNDRENYAQLIESDNGERFYDWLIDNTNKYNLNYLNVNYSGRKGVFLEFKSTVEIPPLDGSATVDAPDIMEVENTGISTFADMPNVVKRKKQIFANPGDFKGRIDEYEFAKDIDLSGVENIFEGFESYKTFIQNQTGIRVYRDGFGVGRLGLDGDDWLKLGSNQTSGSSFYGLRPKNVIGFVAISAKENQNLKEKTDREGFMDNPYSRNFNLIISELVVGRVNEMLENIKRSYNSYRTKYGIDQTGLSNLSSTFSSITRTGNKAESLQEEVKGLEKNLLAAHDATHSLITKVKGMDKSLKHGLAVKNVTDEIDAHFEETKRIIEKLNSLLPDASKLKNAVHILEPQIAILTNQVKEFSELAGLGLTAESLSHEIDNILDRLLTQCKRFSQYLKDENIKNKEIFLFVEHVNSAISGLRKQISHLSSSLRYVRESKDTISINNFLRDTESFYKDRLKANAIKIKIEASSNNDFDILFNRGKLTQIFDNIILNSEYWLKERGKTNKSFASEIIIKNKRPFIQITDNGFGVDPSVETRIFQPFVTSKPKDVGRGLGLFIVQQLLENYGCDIVLLPEKNKYDRRYIFQINFSNVIK